MLAADIGEAPSPPLPPDARPPETSPVPALAEGGGFDKATCTFSGKQLFGKVQIVTAFPDVKVQVVDAFPDVKVQFVTAFPGT